MIHDSRNAILDLVFNGVNDTCLGLGIWKVKFDDIFKIFDSIKYCQIYAGVIRKNYKSVIDKHT